MPNPIRSMNTVRKITSNGLRLMRVKTGEGRRRKRGRAIQWSSEQTRAEHRDEDKRVKLPGWKKRKVWEKTALVFHPWLKFGLSSDRRALREKSTLDFLSSKFFAEVQPLPFVNCFPLTAVCVP